MSEYRYTQMMTGAELLEADEEVVYLIDGILAAGQHTVIGAPLKCMKTHVALDLAISLGSGTPFLGHFKTLGAVPVGFWSGESGKATIKKAAKRIAAKKGIDLTDAQVDYCFSLPEISSEEDVFEVCKVVKKRGHHVVVIDPLYLCLDQATSMNMSNVAVVGRALNKLPAMLAEGGITTVFVHHTKKEFGRRHAAPELTDLTQAGVAEWMRQWILLSRRKPYLHDYQHLLHLNVGGSAGHSAIHKLHIDEATWEIKIDNSSAHKVETPKALPKKTAREARDSAYRTRLISLIKATPKGVTVNGAKTELGGNDRRAKKILDRLVDEGVLTKDTNGRVRYCMSK